VSSNRVTYEVEEIRGKCPVYDVGDKMVFDSFASTEIVNLTASDAVCMRAVANAWNDLMYQWGDDSVVGYLASGTGEVRCACSMPGEPYTPCGYCIFRVTREPLDQEQGA